MTERAVPAAEPKDGAQLELLLEFLRDNRGFDFTGYKRASLARRISRRMQQIGVATYPEYVDHLQFHPDEFGVLFNTILINVTSFFRDPDAWGRLQQEILPSLLAGKDGSATLRAWSAGSAGGAEAYTTAIVLAELLGVAEFRDRVKIYATDVDEDALGEARQALFTEREVEGVPEALREKYFEPQNGRLAFRKDLRRCVIFGRNDLVQDAPISRVDLLVCRNTLMYFNAETQDRILRRFHFALTPDGVLFLGKAETMLSQSRMFRPLDSRRRLFAKVPVVLDPDLGPIIPRRSGQEQRPETDLLGRALDAAPEAALVISGEGLLAAVNRRARELFRLDDRDLARPFRELDASLRPLDLRPLLDRVIRERAPAQARGVAWDHGDQGTTYHDVTVVPLAAAAGGAAGPGSGGGTAIFFSDTTAVHRLESDLHLANQQLEASYEELQSTVEELETTNEELQSTVEELETTNEELQSTNEELETTNEELQSTNDELHSANEELNQRTAEIVTANLFMESLLRSIDSSVVAVDSQLVVTAWSPRSEEQWGLRSDEVVGQHLMNLDIGLPVTEIYPSIRRVLAGGVQQDQLEVDAVNRRGRALRVLVRCRRLTDPADELTGAILFVDERHPEG